MKLHKYIIGLALLVSSSSCNFLDEEAYEFITPDNFYKTEADANAALTAVYNTFADEKSYRRYSPHPSGDYFVLGCSLPD